MCCSWTFFFLLSSSSSVHDYTQMSSLCLLICPFMQARLTFPFPSNAFLLFYNIACCSLLLSVVIISVLWFASIVSWGTGNRLESLTAKMTATKSIRTWRTEAEVSFHAVFLLEWNPILFIPECLLEVLQMRWLWCRNKISLDSAIYTFKAEYKS